MRIHLHTYTPYMGPGPLHVRHIPSRRIQNLGICCGGVHVSKMYPKSHFEYPYRNLELAYPKDERIQNCPGVARLYPKCIQHVSKIHFWCCLHLPNIN